MMQTKMEQVIHLYDHMDQLVVGTHMDLFAHKDVEDTYNYEGVVCLEGMIQNRETVYTVVACPLEGGYAGNYDIQGLDLVQDSILLGGYAFLADPFACDRQVSEHSQ